MMKKDLTPYSYFDLLEACAKPGCPQCRLSEKWVNSYLDAIMYESVNDPGTREQLHRSLGYCNEHAWRLPDTSGGAALGIAIIYRDLAGRILSALEKARFVPANRLSLRQAQELLDREKPTVAMQALVRGLQPHEECPACAHRDRMETIALTAMLNALAQGDERMQAALISSAGLCLPHLRRAFELARDEAAFDKLLAIGMEQVAALAAELDEFIRKSDYRFNKDGFGPEGAGWRRALAWMVGAKGVR
jgi:uncharacterized protein DUF6062